MLGLLPSFSSHSSLLRCRSIIFCADFEIMDLPLSDTDDDGRNGDQRRRSIDEISQTQRIIRHAMVDDQLSSIQSPSNNGDLIEIRYQNPTGVKMHRKNISYDVLCGQFMVSEFLWIRVIDSWDPGVGPF